MKIIIVLFYLLLSFISKSQSNVEKADVKVVSLKKHSSGYLIKGIRVNMLDTIYILSYSDSINRSKQGKKIKRNKMYIFFLDDFARNGIIVGGTYTILFGKEIVWRTGDSPNKIPYYSKNTIGRRFKK